MMKHKIELDSFKELQQMTSNSQSQRMVNTLELWKIMEEKSKFIICLRIFFRLFYISVEIQVLSLILV